MKIPEGADAYFFDDIDLVVLMFPKKYEDDREESTFYCVDCALHDTTNAERDEPSGGVILSTVENEPTFTGRVYQSGESEWKFKDRLYFSDVDEIDFISKWLRRCHERASEYFPEY